MSKLTDGQWRKLIERASATWQKAKELRELAEDEYEMRYGRNPSDVDDDWWIDTIEHGSGQVNLNEIKRQAAESCRNQTTTTSSTKATSESSKSTTS